MSNLNPGGLTRVLNYIKTWVTGLLNGKANSSHTHTKSQITDFPVYGNTAGTICQGNDSRLSDARTPYFANNTWYAVGDDAAIGDHNVGGGLGVKSLNNATTRIDLCYKDDASNYKSITYDGTTLYMNGNCNYANSAGYATTSAKLIGDDTRNNNYTPANYINSSQRATIRSEFKLRSTLGAPGDSTYGTSVTITPWSDNSGGRSVQLYFSDSGYTSAIRFATGDSSWSSWYQLNTEYYTKLNGYRIYVG